MLSLMYITNRPEVALTAEAAGVDRVLVDLEFIGKEERQAGLDTVKSRHRIGDVGALSGVLTRAELMVRVNPVHRALPDYPSSREEIERVLGLGAERIMLPYFRTVREAEIFLALVDGRAKTTLLLETPEAVSALDGILALPGIDEMFVGLNDLSLGYGMRFMFEPLADGTVDALAARFRERGLPFGFGGIASLGRGLLPAEYVISEHYRLGSSSAILSRSFCDASAVTDPEALSAVFRKGVGEIRAWEAECGRHRAFFEDNRRQVSDRVSAVCGGRRA